MEPGLKPMEPGGGIVATANGAGDMADADDWTDEEGALMGLLMAPDRQRIRPRGAAGGTHRRRRGLEMADGRDDVFVPSQACSENEQAALQEALGTFYADHVILDVVARVKGGKEANVYCCLAHPSTGLELVAAKIYRPRAHRTMRNDAVYREGRLMLDEEGKGIVRDARLKRAVARKTDFGRELMTFSWIEHEASCLRSMFAAGADVPRLVGHAGSAILMEYVGRVNAPAPVLAGVHLGSPAEARRLLDRLLWHVELLLRLDRVHGDLSAYNVLYWDGRGVLIDFPQAVVAWSNPNAEWLLHRDVERLCQYFERYGIKNAAASIADDLWRRYERAQL